jgi:Zn ribbon nucleic-acid-binding protein
MPEFTIQTVGFRIKHTRCPKCWSENIVAVWRCTEPEIVSYECEECGQITREKRERSLREVEAAEFDPRDPWSYIQ